MIKKKKIESDSNEDSEYFELGMVRVLFLYDGYDGFMEKILIVISNVWIKLD